MPNYTTHYHLEKPLQEEFYDVDVFNGNADILDGKLHEIESRSAPTKVSDLENDSGFITAATAPVRSVNSRTGDVNLSAADVGAAATSHKHSASDITSGILPVARGGTGVSTLDTAPETVGLRKIYAGTDDMVTGITPLATGTMYLMYE